MSPADSGGVGMWQQRLLLLPPSTGRGHGAGECFLQGLSLGTTLQLRAGAAGWLGSKSLGKPEAKAQGLVLSWLSHSCAVQGFGWWVRKRWLAAALRRALAVPGHARGTELYGCSVHLANCCRKEVLVWVTASVSLPSKILLLSILVFH